MDNLATEFLNSNKVIAVTKLRNIPFDMAPNYIRKDPESTQKELKEQGRNISVMDLNAIYAAIPKEWYKTIKLKIDGKSSEVNKTVSKGNKITKYAFWEFMDRMPRLDDKYRSKWEYLVDKEIPDKDWENALAHVNCLIGKLKNTDKCTFCEQQIETCIHLFVKCNRVQYEIWKPLKRWLYYFCNIDPPCSLNLNDSWITMRKYIATDSKDSICSLETYN